MTGITTSRDWLYCSDCKTWSDIVSSSIICKVDELPPPPIIEDGLFDRTEVGP